MSLGFEGVFEYLEGGGESEDAEHEGANGVVEGQVGST